MSNVIQSGVRRGASLEEVVDRVICLDWNDGPMEGALRCHGDSREYRFDLVDSANSLRYRVFLLTPLPSGAIDRFADVLTRNCNTPPQWPVWFPEWRFQTMAARDDAEVAADELCRSSAPAEAAFCWDDYEDRLLAYREMNAADPPPQDWFEWLGL